MTSPRSVNLIALPTRLTITWRRRPESPNQAVRNVGGDPAGQLQSFAVGAAGQRLEGLVQRVAQAERSLGPD